MWSNVTTGIVGGHQRQVALEPGELEAVDVSVVPLVIDVHGVEPHEVHAAAGERVVVGAAIVVVHLRGRTADASALTCDLPRSMPKILVVARHREHRRS